MNLTKLRKWRPNYVAVAFCIPFFLILILMYLQNVTPFGNRMMLYSDQWHQYYPFFKSFREAIRNGESLLYNWEVGMGVDYLGLISYYLGSPLNLISVILPDSMVLPYFSMLLPIKLGFASMFFAIFLKKLFNKPKTSASIAVFGSFYALCAWALGYQWNIMWLDTFAMLPLVALGTIYLLRDRKVVLYTVTLALSVLFNYYIGLFTCIFVMLLFCCYQICRCKSWKRLGLDFCRIAVFSIVAIAMTAILTLPAYTALGKTFSSVNGFPDSFYMNIVDYEVYEEARAAWNAYSAAKDAGDPTFGLFFTAIWETIPPLLSGMGEVAGNMSGGVAPTLMDGLPNVYCGVSTLFLSFMFLMAGNVKLRDKLCCIFLLLFFMVSFVIRELDYIWHGFHFPNSIPHRFSFLYSFIMLYMAYRAYLVRHRFKLLHFVIAGVLTVEMFLLSSYYETLPAAFSSIGDFISLLIQTIGAKLSGDAATAETAIASLKYLYTTYLPSYIFILFNGGFFLIYFTIMVVTRIRRKIPKSATHEDKVQIVTANRRHRKLCTGLLLSVMALELVANVANFERNYQYTSTKNYPQGTEYTASMIRYMKERETSLFYRAETTRTQTLNDGPMNGYYGISAFTSSANANTTRFLTAMGLSAQDNWNRYSFENGSPVSNLFLNLKYMIERNGQLEENPYFDNIHHYDKVYLLENNAYLPLGFLTESELGQAEMIMSSGNAFWNQNLMFSAATGIQQDVWINTPNEWLTIEGSNANITYKDSSGLCYYTASDSGGSIVYRYNIQEEGFLCLDINMWSRNSFTVYYNQQILFSDSVVLPQTMSVCQVHPGDVVEIWATCPAGEVSNMNIKSAILDDKVFRRGYDKLNASTLELTEFANDNIVGTIDCNRDGLLYTSITNDGNWIAYVDGEEAEIVTVGGAMIGLNLTKGQHEIEFVYRNTSFTYGVLISVFALQIFLGLVYLYDRERWNERFLKLRAKLKKR